MPQVVDNMVKLGNMVAGYSSPLFTLPILIWLTVCFRVKVSCQNNSNNAAPVGSCEIPTVSGGVCAKPKSPTYCFCPTFFSFENKDCPKVSPPREIFMHIIGFDTKSETFSVNISWSEPLYAANYLWGYQLTYYPINALRHDKYCLWLLSKRTWFVLRDVDPTVEYKISVLSLPRYVTTTARESFEILQLPDKCKTLKNHNITSFECASVERLEAKLDCPHNAADLTWDIGSVEQYDIIVLYVVQDGNRYAMEEFKLGKNTTRHQLMPLKRGVPYQVEVAFTKDRTLSRRAIVEFQCPVEMSNHSWQVFTIISLSCGFIVLLSGLAVVVILRRNRRKRKERFVASLKSNLIYSAHMDEETAKAPTVLVLHYPGCIYVENMALIFVELLRKSGINAISYKHESQLIHTLSPGGYLNERLGSVEKTITFYTEHFDSVDNYISGQLVNLAVTHFSNEYSNGTKAGRHISLYLKLPLPFLGGNYTSNTLATVPPMLKHKAYAFPSQMKDVIALLIPHEKIPSMNSTIHLDECLVKQIRTATEATLECYHVGCLSNVCLRGTRPIRSEELKRPLREPDPQISQATSEDSLVNTHHFKDCIEGNPLLTDTENDLEFQLYSGRTCVSNEEPCQS